MEQVIQLHIEKLPEGLYLATSDDVQGLVAQGRTLPRELIQPCAEPLHRHPKPPGRQTRGHVARHPQASWCGCRGVFEAEATD